MAEAGQVSRRKGIYEGVFGLERDPPAIGPRLHQLRKEQGMTLDALAALSGVSRSMLSQIERGQANPTLATVWHLSRALSVEIAEFVGGERIGRRGRIELTAATFVPEIRTADGRCVLKILSPAPSVGQFECYHLTLEPHAELVSEAHAMGSSEHLTVLHGELTVTSAETTAIVGEGAIARYPADVPHAIRNPGASRTEALLVVMS
ncbi:XRE family transcriptional regulator [Novosphingobium sp. H3SJ31-1]|uniref:XRE family transcriptional regulator n=2 Tax=Novosphingobium album (ex Liu et al. 2023) TaxID=3031130 RepID=A0ABT5WQ77_9SPHN|nr:XRE family transcriptional regulator [Novosphingobium album (ex Liu et al. 2023)]MDE8652034.1 XRE family transcriptional regulator [Novosphingobium album (ex Liu et al. 2023)]